MLLAVPIAMGCGMLAATTGVAQAVSCPTVDTTTGAVTPQPTPGVDWSSCDLAGADLVDFNLSGVNFSAANLSNADFITSVLTSANLSGADLSTTQFNNASLTGADLAGATVTNANFLNAVLTDSNLATVDLGSDSLVGVKSGGISVSQAPSALPTGWKFIGGYLVGAHANLDGADLQGANLSNMDLAYVTMSGANLADTDLAGAQMALTSFGSVRSGGITGRPASFPVSWTLQDGYILGVGADLQGADLAGQNLAGLDLSQTTLTKADLAKANLTGTKLTSSDLAGADVKGAIFAGTGLSQANLSGDDFAALALVSSDLSYATLKGANLTGASLNGDNLTGANLAGTRLAGLRSGSLIGIPSDLPANWSSYYGYLLGPQANLSGGQLRGDFLFDLDLAGATLTGVNLTEADVAGTDLTGARLTDANLSGANLTGAELTGADPYLRGVKWSSVTCPDGKKAGKNGCFAPQVQNDRVPQLSLTTRVGPPTTAVQVTGTGFKARERLTVLVGTTYRAVVRTGNSGAFGPVAVTIPAAARPGLGTVSATAKAAGQSASAWFTVQTDWAQAGFGPALSGYNNLEDVLAPANVSKLGKSWVFNPGATEANAPTIADGIAYVTTLGGKLYAVNTTSGHVVWNWTDTGLVTSQDALAQPAVIGNTAYFSDSNYLYAVGPGGKQDWSVLEDSPPSAMTVDAGVLYVTAGGYVYAIDPATGSQLWRADPAQTSGCASQPAASGGVIYVTCGDGELYALSATTGNTLWQFAGSGGGMMSPVVSGPAIYVADSTGDAVYAIGTKTRSQLWSFTASSRIGSTPAVARGVVYATAFDGHLYALNALTGARLWRFNLGSTIPAAVSPAVANGVVYVTSPNEVAFAVNAQSGRELWSYSSGNLLQSAPVVANGHVYVGTGDGGLYAFGLPRG